MKKMICFSIFCAFAFWMVSLTACQTTGYRKIASESTAPSLLPEGTKITLGEDASTAEGQSFSGWTAKTAVNQTITFCLLMPAGQNSPANFKKGKTYTLRNIASSTFVDVGGQPAFNLKCTRNIGPRHYQDETELPRILAVLTDNQVTYSFPEQH